MRTIDISANKIFFTSDIHFGHKWLLKFNKRPFEDEKAMDDVLIKNWNKVVPCDGLVFVLGDIGETSDERIVEIFNELTGTKILVRGNHDTIFKKESLQEIFLEIHDLLEIKVFDTSQSQFQEIVLFHYPMFDWNRFHEGSWQLFGHIHTRDMDEFKTLNARLFAQQYDVGVDGNNFRPVSYYQVKEIISKQMQDKSFKQSNYY